MVNFRAISSEKLATMRYILVDKGVASTPIRPKSQGHYLSTCQIGRGTIGATGQTAPPGEISLLDVAGLKGAADRVEWYQNPTGTAAPSRVLPLYHLAASLST